MEDLSTLLHWENTEGCFLGPSWFEGITPVALSCTVLTKAHWLLDKILGAKTAQIPTSNPMHLPSQEGMVIKPKGPNLSIK